MAVATAGLLVVLASGSCSSSTEVAQGTDLDTAFEVRDISVQQGELDWRINRPIDILFTKDVDLSTVSLNTVRIVDASGDPATGSFSVPLVGGVRDPKLIRFQPACPTRADNTDAGFRPGGVFYTIVVPDTGTTVRSTAGEFLDVGGNSSFTTPNSIESQDLFLDTVPGPPAPRLRGTPSVGPTALNATYLEFGGNTDPASRVYFFLDSATQTGQLPAGFQVPLNKYADMDSQFAMVLHLNQPIQPSEENLDPGRVTFQYRDNREPAGMEWLDIATRVELEANCTETGAALRLTPLGLLPQGAALRVIVRQGFEDLTGAGTNADLNTFARMTAVIANNVATANPEVDGDGLIESFTVGGDTIGSLEDTNAALGEPRAEWSDGLLTAAFDFSGTGGSGEGFDWVVQPNTDITIDTTAGTITGPGGPGDTQSVITGMIDVRNVTIPASSSVTFQGPDPVTIMASGRVTIGGRISVNGNHARQVTDLDTTDQPEVGASGQAGGGSGGIGSFLTSQSTPRGGRGAGAFNRPNRGGQGGETSYIVDDKDGRRAAGGGGGRLGPDVLYPFVPPMQSDAFFVPCQTLVGMDAERGFAGGLEGLGSESQSARAQGGAPAPSPFEDQNADNNFFGSLVVDAGLPTQRLIFGEFDRLWAGSGGGAGGDSVNFASFPLVPFDSSADEKGAGGGGGAGGLRILAIGPIIVEDGGRITADGGRGAGGENTGGFDRVGGGSGGGSGGHIVLASADYISVAGEAPTGVAAGATGFYNDVQNAMQAHSPRAISALGGQGGAGHDDEGGVSATGASQWSCDAIPFPRFRDIVRVNSGGMEVEFDLPPEGEPCYQDDPTPPALRLVDLDDEAGPVLGAGGDGGPGMIQFHVPNPAVNLRFPLQQSGDGMGGFNPAYGDGLDVTLAVAPPPVGFNDVDDVDNLVPFFGTRSVAQSRWIPLGLARLDPIDTNGNFNAVDDQVVLRFGGTDTMNGRVEVDPFNTVDPVTAILGPDPLQAAPTTPYIDPTSDGSVIVFDSDDLMAIDEIYEREPSLMRGFVVVLAAGLDSSRFTVVDQVLEVTEGGPSQTLFHLTVATETGSLDDFVDSAGAPVVASLEPNFFRVVTNDVNDAVPPDAAIVVAFDATVADEDGNPDPDAAFSAQLDMGDPVGFTFDISELNAQNWDFLRFRVEFDLDGSDNGLNLDDPLPALRFLRIPFEY